MRIPTFEIREQRSVSLAACAAVPPLMVVAGPNGSGKSTLLDALRRAPGVGRILYVSPHRASRRQVVQQRHLHVPIEMEDLLARPDTPGFEGINLFGGARDPWSYDDTANYLKHGLCQIEMQRSAAITARFDRDGAVARADIRDPWEPLRDLTSNLLPHLEFHSIDTSNPQQVRCLWRVHGGTLVDLDDLSSGERSIVQMFYPLIEHDVKALLASIQEEAGATERGDVAVLIDEPELHLHPNLQLKVYDYLRHLAARGDTQFILATHSPTIVEYASFDELFLLRPIELVDGAENQLVQIASDEERLALIRDVFGATSNLTSMQPVVVVEGTRGGPGSNAPADRKVFRALHSGFDRVTLVPGGGKNECIALVKALQEILPDFSGRLRVVGLLDRDLDEAVPPEGVGLLPVSTIENFGLDPYAIWEAVQSVVDKTTLRAIEDVEAELDSVLDSMEDYEVERRVLQALGYRIFRPKRPIEEIARQTTSFLAEVGASYSEARISGHTAEARAAVTVLRESHRRRELFDGKAVSNAFYQRHLHSSGLPKSVFTYESARHARSRKAVQRFFADFFGRLLGTAAPVAEEVRSVAPGATSAPTEP